MPSALCELRRAKGRRTVETDTHDFTRKLMARRPFDANVILADLLRSGTGRRFDFRIDARGDWFYQGSRIDRPEMVKLFASILRRAEDGSYWLITPVEQGRIEVDDAPFVIQSMTTEGDGHARQVTFIDNIERHHRLTRPGQLTMRQSSVAAGTVPYLTLNDGLDARLTQSVFYELADSAEEAPESPDSFGIWSGGHFFSLGAAS